MSGPSAFHVPFAKHGEQQSLCLRLLMYETNYLYPFSAKLAEHDGACRLKSSHCLSHLFCGCHGRLVAARSIELGWSHRGSK